MTRNQSSQANADVLVETELTNAAYRKMFFAALREQYNSYLRPLAFVRTSRDHFVLDSGDIVCSITFRYHKQPHERPAFEVIFGVAYNLLGRILRSFDPSKVTTNASPHVWVQLCYLVPPHSWFTWKVSDSPEDNGQLIGSILTKLVTPLIRQYSDVREGVKDWEAESPLSRFDAEYYSPAAHLALGQRNKALAACEMFLGRMVDAPKIGAGSQWWRDDKQLDRYEEFVEFISTYEL